MTPGTLHTIGTACGLGLLGTHFLLSHPPVRGRLVAALGEGPFQGGYSLVALALYLPWAGIWWHQLHAGAAWWSLRTPAVTHAMELVAAAGVALAVSGVVTPAPSSVTGPHGPQLEVRGITHVTRHPLNVGVALILVAHLVMNGWVADVVFLGGNLVLAVLGPLHQDHRLAARPGYADFAARTTVLPNPLGLARIGGRAWAVLAVGLALAFALRYAHRWLPLLG
jgi:uncharacterized membrane protein